MKKIMNKELRIKKNTKTKCGGFSLLETLLYLSLLIILVGGITTFMYTMIETNKKVNTISVVDDEANHAIKLMTQYIRNAQLVNIPNVNGGSDTLLLNVFDTPNSPAVFSLLNDAIVLSEGGNGAVAVTSSALKITNLSFVNLALPNSKSSIKISFKANSQTTSVKQEYNYGKTYEAVASLRN